MTGKTIKTIRNEYGFSQENFAKMFRISRSTLAMIEVEKRKPSTELVSKINFLFDLDEITKAQMTRAKLLTDRMLGKV